MKTVTIVCLLCATTAYAFPAASDEFSTELMRPFNRKGVPSVVDDDVSIPDDSSFFFPSSFFRPFFFNPFHNFNFGFSNMFPSSPFGWGGLFNMFGGVPADAKVTNSTSSVKVIDGQKVTVNVTTYEKDGAIFKYQVIEMVRDKPEGGDVTIVGSERPLVITTTRLGDTSIESTSPKTDNNSLDNEIFREEVSPPDQTDDLIA